MRAFPTLSLCTFGFLVSTGFAQTVPSAATPAAAPQSSPSASNTAPASGPASAPATVVASDPSASLANTKTTPPAATVHPLSNPSLAGFTFEAPAAEKKRMEQQAQAAVEAEEEKPRNGIIRLPTYETQGERPPVFSEKTINTKKGLGEIAVKRYLSPAQQALNKIALPSWLGGLSNEDLALEMYREDERLNTMHDLSNAASLYQAAGDKASAEELKKDAQDMYIRPRDPAEPAYLRQSSDAIPSNNLNR